MLFSRTMFLVIPDMLFSRTTHLFLVIPDMLYPAGIFSHGQLTRFSSSRTCLTSNSIFSHGQLACFSSSPTYISPGHLTCFSSSRTCCAQLVSFLPDTSLVTSPDRLLLSRLWQTCLLYHELQHLIWQYSIKMMFLSAVNAQSVRYIPAQNVNNQPIHVDISRSELCILNILCTDKN